MMKNIIIITVFTLILGGCINPEIGKSCLEIYYFPIGAQTYIPITTENIEERALRHGYITGAQASRLLKIISTARTSTSFDEMRVRVKVIPKKKQLIYLDTVGGMLYNGQTWSLDAQSLLSIKRLIERNLVDSQNTGGCM